MGLCLGSKLDTEGRQAERGLVTTSLAIAYLGRAGLGQWLEFDTIFIQAGRRHGVAQSFVTADGETIARF